jgi:hypothetical protein
MSTDITRRQPRKAGIDSRITQAIERMIELGEPWDEAARNVNLTVRAMRKALTRPNVIQYLKRRREVFREAASAGNIRRLVEVRQQNTNLMAATKAIQILESLGEDEFGRRGGSSAPLSPGLIIQIVSDANVTTPRAPLIDVTMPAPASEPNPEPVNQLPIFRPSRDY